MATRFLFVVFALLPAVARAQLVEVPDWWGPPAFVRPVAAGDVVTASLRMCEFGIFELTPPANGILRVRATWDPADGPFEVDFADTGHYGETGSLLATQVVTAGRKTNFVVGFWSGWWDCFGGGPWSFTVEISMAPSEPCSFAVWPRVFSVFTAEGHQGTINVATSDPGCLWSASEDVDWVSLRNTGGRGSGMATFELSPNVGTEYRFTKLTVAGESVFVSQNGTPSAPCSYTVSPTSAEVTWEGGQGSVNVSTSNPGCEWSASADVDWVTLNVTRFRGPAVVTFDVGANNALQQRFATLRIAGESVTVGQSGMPDEDGDRLPTSWEMRFGLDPTSASGLNGASGDPDGDGISNSEELLAGTHPRGLFTRYFAEGVTSDFFDLRLAFLNPNSTVARALVQFRTTAGTTESSALEVPSHSMRTLSPKVLPQMNGAEFSTVVESDQPLVADRTITWNAAAYGSHAETSIAAPAMRWYLAEGSTAAGFQLFYLLQNPNPSAAQVLVRYLRPTATPLPAAGPGAEGGGGAGDWSDFATTRPLEKVYDLPPNSRSNIWVNVEDFPGLGRALAASDVSAAIEVINGPPIVVERAMYLNTPGQVFGAGHESAGVTAPATEWFLAEGATGPFFDLYVLVANPSDAAALVEATYLLPDGIEVKKPYTIAAGSRFNIHVDLEDPRLANTGVSTTVRSLNDVPIVVERAMWWPDGGWYEGHNSPGVTTTGTAWALAEGEVGGAQGVETYILVANTSETTGTVKVTLLFEDGTSIDKVFAVTARSRFNINVRDQFPAALNKRFGVLVESQGPEPVQLVVERSMYWNASGQFWAAGTNAHATRLQ